MTHRTHRMTEIRGGKFTLKSPSSKLVQPRSHKSVTSVSVF